jgi:hypothetical protein
MTDTRDPYDPPLRSGRTPWRRNWGLGLVVIAGFVLGTPVTRLLDTYRGIVLNLDGDKMFLAFENKPPKLYDAMDGANPGTIVTKERGHWSAEVSEALGRDIKLIQMQKRYVSEYDATILRIDKPLSVQQASVAVAKTSDGNVLRVPLYAAELASAAVGRHLKKFANSWDPVLIDDAVPAIAAPPSTNAAAPVAAPEPHEPPTDVKPTAPPVPIVPPTKS